MDHEAPKTEPSPTEEPGGFPSQLLQGSDRHGQPRHSHDIAYSHSASGDIPAEFTRVQTGESVLDSSAVWYDNGRSYHSYKEGKYLLPNDGVRYIEVQRYSIIY